MSMSILTAVGTTTEPTASSGMYARLKYALMSVKAYDVAETINPVRINHKPVAASLFG
jgi:hypothetical protein